MIKKGRDEIEKLASRLIEEAWASNLKSKKEKRKSPANTTADKEDSEE